MPLAGGVGCGHLQGVWLLIGGVRNVTYGCVCVCVRNSTYGGGGGHEECHLQVCVCVCV